jgi:predicted nucleic acid-binding protein
MIYLDTSVAIAQLLSEERVPPEALWREQLCSSRLFHYELMVRLNRERSKKEVIEAAEALCGRLTTIEMRPDVLARILEPFPISLRTLDAIHLATAQFLSRQGTKVRIATYDIRMREAATAMNFDLVRLP